MATTAGKSAVVYMTGTSTAMTGEAMGLVSGKIYQITNTAKRCVNPLVAITVKDDGDTVPADDYTINFLYGIVTFGAGYTPTTPITIDGEYLPMIEIATANQWSLSYNADIVDVTPFSTSASNHEKVMTIAECSGSIGTLDFSETDHDSGAGNVIIWSILTGNTAKILQLTMGGSSTSWRGCVLLESDEISTGAADVVKSTLSFKTQPQLSPTTGTCGTWAWSQDTSSY